MAPKELPIPTHFDPGAVGQVWRVSYQQRADDALKWAAQHRIQPSSQDRFKIALLLVDVQNTFCIPEFELYVRGRSGSGAVDDNRRLCKFIYRNLNAITRICPTMDTHQAVQIFHSQFLVNEQGEHPAPFTLVTAADVSSGKWKFNPAVADSLNIDPAYGQKFLQHYTRQLRQGGKYDLTIWPYHAMLGGIGHALVAAVEEALFYHCLARASQPGFEIKGFHPFTENYSVLRPEVLQDPEGEDLAGKNTALLSMLLNFDAVFIAGQAKSHCVAWSVEDLRKEIAAVDPQLMQKVYLLEDCTSPVVIPGVIDYSDPADEAFQRFADAGMHVVQSTDSLVDLPGIAL